MLARSPRGRRGRDVVDGQRGGHCSIVSSLGPRPRVPDRVTAVQRAECGRHDQPGACRSRIPWEETTGSPRVGPVIADIVAQLIGYVIGGSAADSVTRRRRAAAAGQGRLLGGLRTVSGSQRGLSREWLIGEWEVCPGRLTLGAVMVPVVETVGGSRRPARLNELVGASDSVVVTLRTETAVLEWSQPRQFDDAALRALSVPDGRP